MFCGPLSPRITRPKAVPSPSKRAERTLGTSLGALAQHEGSRTLQASPSLPFQQKPPRAVPRLTYSADKLFLKDVCKLTDEWYLYESPDGSLRDLTTARRSHESPIFGFSEDSVLRENSLRCSSARPNFLRTY